MGLKGSGKPHPGTVAIIPAAGAGIRMGGGRPKQFLQIGGRPLLLLTLERFEQCPDVEAVIVVVPSQEVDYCRREIVEKHGLRKIKGVLAGGERRQDSVRIGIEASAGEYEYVLIHDGVRPLIWTDLISRIVIAAREDGAVIAALPAKETVKEADENGYVTRTHVRGRVWLIQTPQVFRYREILMAHRRALEEGWGEVTDDSQLMERMGIPVKVIEGSEENIKITTPHDLELARIILQMRGRGEMRTEKMRG